MNLNISFAELRDTGKNISKKAGEFKELLTKIDTINNNLKKYWEGSDASKYAQAVEQQAQIMNELYKKIDDIGSFLVKVSDAYQAARDNNVGNINI